MGYSTLEIHSAAMSQQVVRYVQCVHVQDDGCQTCFYQDDGFQTCFIKTMAARLVFIKTMAARLVLSRRWLPNLFYQDDGCQTCFYQDDGCQTCFIKTMASKLVLSRRWLPDLFFIKTMAARLVFMTHQHMVGVTDFTLSEWKQKTVVHTANYFVEPSGYTAP